MQQPKSRIPRKQPIEDSKSTSPPWESRFVKFGGMTKEMYDELEPDNKEEFIKVYVKDD